jgi:uncharacterized membrane protein HdeD (DUF308 family)
MWSVLDGGWREIDTARSLENLVQVRRHWRLHLALGVLLVALGGVALANAFLSAAGSALMFGWLLIASGVLQALLASQVQSWTGFSLHVLGGILEIVVGLLVIGAPGSSLLMITLLVAVYLLVGGLFRVITGLSLDIPCGGWAALGGLLSFLLGLAIWRQGPASGLWFIGTCVGLDLIFHGAVWVVFALDVHRVRHPVGIRAR